MSNYDQMSQQEIEFQAGTSLSQVTIALGIGTFLCLFFGLFELAGALLIANMAESPELLRRMYPPQIYGQFSQIFTPSLMSICMAFVGILLLVGAVLLVLACYFSRERKNYQYILAVSALSLLQFPVGSIIGIFCLVNLTKKPVKSLFTAKPRPLDPPNKDWQMPTL